MPSRLHTDTSKGLTKIKSRRGEELLWAEVYQKHTKNISGFFPDSFFLIFRKAYFLRKEAKEQKKISK
jgi:hypothetical protein